MNSEKESQLKRIRKSSFLLSQEKSLAEKVKKYPYLFNKSQKSHKERDVFQTHISCFDYFFRSFKNKNNIMSNSLSSILISAK